MDGMDINANSVQAFQLQGNKPPIVNNVLTRSQRRALIQEKLDSAVPNKIDEEEEEKDLDYDPYEDM